MPTFDSSRVNHANLMIPVIYHANFEERSEPWEFPSEDDKGKIAQMEYDYGNHRHVRSLPFHLILMVMRGSVEYTINGQGFLAEENMLIVVPPYAQFHIRAVKLPMRYAWIHFKLWLPVQAQPHADVPAAPPPSPLKEEVMLSGELQLEEGIVGLDNLLMPDEPQLIKRLMTSAVEEILLEKPGWMITSRSYLQSLLALLYRDMTVNETHHADQIKDLNIARAIECIQRSYNKKLTVEYLAREASLSLHYFIPRFKKITGYTPGQYIAIIRINQAKKLIRSGEYSITEIGFIVGFESASYFSRVFSKVVGLTPKQYKYRE